MLRNFWPGLNLSVTKGANKIIFGTSTKLTLDTSKFIINNTFSTKILLNNEILIQIYGFSLVELVMIYFLLNKL